MRGCCTWVLIVVGIVLLACMGARLLLLANRVMPICLACLTALPAAFGLRWDLDAVIGHASVVTLVAILAAGIARSLFCLLWSTRKICEQLRKIWQLLTRRNRE